MYFHVPEEKAEGIVAVLNTTEPSTPLFSPEFLETIPGTVTSVEPQHVGAFVFQQKESNAFLADAVVQGKLHG